MFETYFVCISLSFYLTELLTQHLYRTLKQKDTHEVLAGVLIDEFSRRKTSMALCVFKMHNTGDIYEHMVGVHKSVRLWHFIEKSQVGCHGD